MVDRHAFHVGQVVQTGTTRPGASLAVVLQVPAPPWGLWVQFMDGRYGWIKPAQCAPATREQEAQWLIATLSR